MTGTIITLELSPKLQQEQIVTRYIFDLNSLDIVLELNHIYDKKLIVSPIEINDWQYTIQSFKDLMEDQNIDKDHITMICDVADKNASKLNGKGKKEKKQKEKQTFTAYKYSYNFKGDLHEAVILSGKPVFIKYNGKTIKAVKSIKEESRIITPPFTEEYAYKSYEFQDLNEVLNILERAKKLSIGSIYGNVYIFNRERLAKVSSALNRDIEKIQTTDAEDPEDPEGNRVSLFEGVKESYIYNNNKNKTKGLGPESSASSGSEPDFTSVKAEVDKLYDKEKQVA